MQQQIDEKLKELRAERAAPPPKEAPTVVGKKGKEAPKEKKDHAAAPKRKLVWASELDKIVAREIALAEMYLLVPSITHHFLEIILHEQVVDAALAENVVRRLLCLKAAHGFAAKADEFQGPAERLPEALNAVVQAVLAAEQSTLGDILTSSPSISLRCLLPFQDWPLLWAKFRDLPLDKAGIGQMCLAAEALVQQHKGILSKPQGDIPPFEESQNPFDRAFRIADADGLFSGASVHSSALDTILSQLKDGLQVCPLAIQAWGLLAAVSFRLGRYISANEAAQKGLQYLQYLDAQYHFLDGAHHAWWFERLTLLQAYSRSQLGNHEMAIRQLERRNTSHPSETLRTALAEVQLASGAIQAAKDTLAPLLATGKPNSYIAFVAASVFVNLSHYAEAESYIKGALAERPSHPYFHFFRGKILWAADRLEDALKCLLDAAKRDADNSRCFTYLGHWYYRASSSTLDSTMQQQHQQRAVRCYQRALELSPAEARAGRQLVRIFCSRNEKEKALTVCKTVVQADLPPEISSWALMLVGHDLLTDAKYTDSLKCFQQALKFLAPAEAFRLTNGKVAKIISPPAAIVEDYVEPYDLAFSRFGLAASHEGLGQYYAALTTYRKALEDLAAVQIQGDQTPRIELRALIRLGMGRILHTLSQWSEALVELQHLTDEATNFVCGWSQKAEVLLAMAKHSMSCDGLYKLAEMQLEDARDNAKYAAYLAPETAHFHKLHGEACFLSSTLPHVSNAAALLDEAEEAYESARVQAEDASVLFALGCVHLQRAKFSESQETREKHRAASETFFRATIGAFTDETPLALDAVWVCLGGAVTETKPAQAQHCFIQALAINPKSHVAWTQLGYLFLRHGKPADAQRAFRNAQTHSPTSAEPWLGQAFCKVRASNEGITPQQRKLFLHAHSIEPSFLTYYFVAAAHLIDPNAPNPASLIYLDKYLAWRPESASALNMLGCNYEIRGKFSAAEQAFRKALTCLDTELAAPQPISVSQVGPKVRRGCILANLLRVQLRAHDVSAAQATLAEIAPFVSPKDPLAALCQAAHNLLKGEIHDALECRPTSFDSFCAYTPMTSPPLPGPIEPNIAFDLAVAAAQFRTGQPLPAIITEKGAMKNRHLAMAVLVLDALGNRKPTSEAVSTVNDEVESDVDAMSLMIRLHLIGKRANQALGCASAWLPIVLGGCGETKLKLSRESVTRFMSAYAECLACAGSQDIEDEVHPLHRERNSKGILDLAPAHRAILALNKCTQPWPLAQILHSIGTLPKTLTEHLIGRATVMQLGDDPFAVDEADESDVPPELRQAREDTQRPRVPPDLEGDNPVHRAAQQAVVACQRSLAEDPEDLAKWRLLGLSQATLALIRGCNSADGPTCCNYAKSAMKVLVHYQNRAKDGDPYVRLAIIHCHMIERNWKEATDALQLWLAEKVSGQQRSTLLCDLATCTFNSTPKDKHVWADLFSKALENENNFDITVRLAESLAGIEDTTGAAIALKALAHDWRVGLWSFWLLMRSGLVPTTAELGTPSSAAGYHLQAFAAMKQKNREEAEKAISKIEELEGDFNPLLAYVRFNL
eukprot:TRINITY_DN4988_c0_g1_i1.p1 TRINITY_DN4988_c0_g1~~TRINITY_DN4988_c0_g1_i1.p1  ORF type:complete len:1707 (-),score=294.75 TRINITY_DN4988_c0_g1_i1:8-4711(-)